ncbi:MAG TPA: Fe-S cluster assembly protein SufD [Mariniphaga sp.]|nr:Fe-S cluster assembly protein SufD [Mariniphaga sp.]
MSVVTEKADLTLKYTAHYNDVKDSIRSGSPELLNALRGNALQDFIRQGIPTRRAENYKYTNLQPAFDYDYEFVHQREAVNVDLNAVFKCDVPQLDTYLGFVSNGWFYENSRQLNELPEGVIVGSLEKIATEKPQLLNRFASLAGTTDEPMVALNTLLAKDGYFLYVPRNVKIDKPIQLVNLLQASQDTYVTQRNFIYLEEGAEVKLLMCDHTMNLNRYLSNSVTEIFVEQNASLDYYALQNQHNNTTSINSVYVHQERDSRASTLFSTLHGGLIRNNQKFVIDGENAEAHLYGMSFLDKKQHVDNYVQVVHASPNCQSNQLFKTILDDESTGAFTGRIHVVRDAQKTNAFQRNNNLLLTDKATMQTKPQLIIDADDVKCSHGATVGQIDEEALFYLRARGIEEKAARLMMMNAFTHEVIQQIQVDPLRDRIDDLVDKRLRGDVARCHECAYNCES